VVALPDSVKEAWEDRKGPVILVTVAEDGTPNAIWAGCVKMFSDDTLVVADLPGLIEGAAEGHGLGHQFLRHVERCRVLLVLADVSDGADTPAEEAVRVLRGELERYSAELATRPFVVAATKVEDDAARARADELAAALGREVRPISSHTGAGVDALLRELHALVLAEAPAS